MPHVLSLRVGFANKREDILENAETDLAAVGVKAKIDRDGYVTLVSLDKSGELNRGAIDRMVADRNAARARKDFKESDRIRDELTARGIVLKDGKDKDGNPVTTWEIAR